MYLNTFDSGGVTRKRKRVGRGIGSTLGKTCGRGHKGQRSRSGGFHKLGFEGGQMPIQRRLPKSGFSSRKSRITDQVCLHELNLLPGNDVSIEILRKAGLIGHAVKFVKIIKQGEISRSFNISGISVTAGAREIIESKNGSIA